MRFTTTLLVTTSFMACAQFPAFAEVDEVAENAAKKLTAESSETVSGRGPVTKDGSGSGVENGISEPSFQLQIDGAKVNGVFSLSYTENDTDIESINGRQTARTKSDRFALKINVPLSEKQEVGTFNFKGIGNGATATLEYASYNGRFAIEDRRYYKILNDSVEKCLVKKAATTNETQVARIFGGLVRNSNGLVGPSTFLDATIPRQHAALTPAVNILRQACVEAYEGGEHEIVNNWGTDSEKRYVQDGVADQFPILFYGVNATLGYDKFDFLDRTNFSISDTGRFSYDGSLYGGLIGRKGNWSLRGTASYTRGFDSPDKVEFCRTLSSSSDEDCISGPNGLPVKKESAFISGELRVLFPIGSPPDPGLEDKRPRFAIAPEFTYDVDENEWAVDVPVYLHRDKKGILDGGVRFGYRSDKDDFAVGLFVGVPFGGIF